jgi:hypothetical protein
MASATSVLSAAQAAALIKGPGQGKAGYASAANLRLIDDSATLAVGVTATATDKVRFGMIPAGAKLVTHLTLLTSNHGTAIAGKIYLTPLDGSTASAGIACNLQAELTEVAAMLDNAACPTMTVDCWSDWIPDADLTSSSTAKTAYLRAVYALLF